MEETEGRDIKSEREAGRGRTEGEKEKKRGTERGDGV